MASHRWGMVDRRVGHCARLVAAAAIDVSRVPQREGPWSIRVASPSGISEIITRWLVHVSGTLGLREYQCSFTLQATKESNDKCRFLAGVSTMTWSNIALSATGTT